MKKQILAISIALLSLSSVAGEMKVIYRDFIESSEKRDSKYDVKNRCTSKLTEIINHVEVRLTQRFEKGFDYECSKVLVSTETDLKRTQWSPYILRMFKIQIAVSCEQRKLSEKAMYSMAKRCEENPTEACFNETLLEKLDAIKPTEFVYKHKGKDCKVLN
ncbi:hypothetical protein HBN50_00990 [Halobacteriovorax sp. GB3]|uniref:hypothetical protein n=1 Tax=Halobacteriovorax sp. GB3 TaxID=2719615 RepID=UPI00235E82D7|nr:hypothetical protein [Halobacteriovorax sp. GB3]MDD0851642.1 hypothetical protein [Halobacteriovorax sp. GB3]